MYKAKSQPKPNLASVYC